MNKSSQIFRIIHAPEHPPLTAEQLRYLLWIEYPKTEWEVWEIEAEAAKPEQEYDLHVKMKPKAERPITLDIKGKEGKP